MARYVKISTIGYPSIQADDSLSFQEVKDYIEGFITEQINQVLPDKPDLILLTEMCDVPQNYTPEKRMEYLKFRGDSYLDYYGKIAKDNNCYIAFCTYRFGAGDFLLNSLIIMDRNGGVAGHYNKNHIVMPGERDQNVLGGNEANLIELDIGKVACAICFDLNFDRIRMHYKELRPEIILFSSMYHGGLKQQFWAQSCQSYFVGSISHSRPSAIISPIGEILAGTTNYFNFVTHTINLDYELTHYDRHTEKLPALKAKYGPAVTVFDPGNIGYFMVTSDHPEISVKEMFKEFGILSYHDYMNEVIASQDKPENRLQEPDVIGY